MQEIDIFGITVKDYDQKETIQLLNRYLDNGGLNLVSYLNTQMLIDAENVENCREWISNLDMTIPAESEILKTAGIKDDKRLKEVGSGVIIKTLVHKLSKNKLPVYLITRTQSEMDALEKELKEIQGYLNIVGRFTLAENDGVAAELTKEREDVMVNDINGLVPKAIISRLEFTKQLRLMNEHKKRINAELWLGLIPGIRLQGLRKHGKMRLNSFFYKKLFSRKFMKYQNDKS